ncbi:MAG: PulJ/GspJ family protein [Gemmatimonadales bacterium]
MLTPPRGRSGFSLVELMLTLVVLTIVCGAVFRLLHTTQRLSRAQAERLGVQSNLRAGAFIVANELRELNGVTGGTPAQNDILSLGPDAITYRAMRGVGFVCRESSTNEIHLARSTFTGQRDPAPGRDSAYLFLEGRPELASDDAWAPAGISAVSTSGSCDAGAAIRLTVATTAAPGPLPVGTPVRLYEIMQLRLYAAAGYSWLGARSVSAAEAIQPVVGPLAAGDGVHFEALDGIGATAGEPDRIRSIRVTIRGVTETNLRDSLATQIALRNVLRP